MVLACPNVSVGDVDDNDDDDGQEARVAQLQGSDQLRTPGGQPPEITHACIPVQPLYMEEAGEANKAAEGASAIRTVKVVCVGSRMGSLQILWACSNHLRDEREQKRE